MAQGWIAVGAPTSGLAHGSVAIFDAQSGTQLFHLEVASVFSGAQFGWALSIEGDRLLTGAPSSYDNGVSGGSAYLFDLNTGLELSRLLAPDAGDDDSFGAAVALAGNLAVVGAPGDDDLGYNSGSVYVFDLSTGAMLYKLLASNGSPKASFGSSVAVDAGRLVVGSPNTDLPGEVYLFDLATGNEIAILRGDATTNPDRFGGALSLEGNTLAVGAREANLPGTNQNSGRVYVFDIPSGQRLFEINAPAPTAYQQAFGATLAMDATTIVVGAWNDYAEHTRDVHLYDRTTGSPIATLLPESPESGSPAGLAIDSGLIVVGYPWTDPLFGSHQSLGRAWAFQFPPPPTAFCFGESCPCGNDDPGAGCANSTGSGALLSASGSTRASLDDLVLSLSGAPPTQNGLVAMATNSPNLPFGDGRLCLGGPNVCRLGVQNTGAGGSFQLGPGIVASTQTLAASCRIEFGQTWIFQVWFRDPAGPCSSGFNLSNALSVIFIP